MCATPVNSMPPQARDTKSRATDLYTVDLVLHSKQTATMFAWTPQNDFLGLVTPFTPHTATPDFISVAIKYMEQHRSI